MIPLSERTNTKTEMTHCVPHKYFYNIINNNNNDSVCQELFSPIRHCYGTCLLVTHAVTSVINYG